MSREQTNSSIPTEPQSQSPLDVSLREFLETEQNQNQGQVQSQSSIPDDIQPFTQQLSSEDMRAWYNPKGVGASWCLNKQHGGATPYKRFKYQVRSGYIEKLAGPTPSYRRLSNHLVSILPLLRENLKNINRFLFLDDNGMSTGQPVNTGDPQLDRIVHILRNDMASMETRIKGEIRKTDDKVDALRTEFNSFKDGMKKTDEKVDALKTEFSSFKRDIKDGMKKTNDKVDALATEFSSFKRDIKDDMKKTNDKVDALANKLEALATEFSGFKRDSKDDMKKTNDKVDALANKLEALATELEAMKKQLQNATNRFENKFKGHGAARHHYLPITQLDGRSLTDVGLEELKNYQQIDNYDDNQIKEYLKFYKLTTAGGDRTRKERLLSYLGLDYEQEYLHLQRKVRII